MTHPLVQAARAYIGHLYVWGGKDDLLFDVEHKALVASPWMPERVFDCSGLVTVALRDQGGPDWRGTHSSGALKDACNPVEFNQLRQGDLLFRPKHVGIFVERGRDSAHAVVLQASGGDQTTTSPAIAAKIGAFVRETEVPLSHFKWAGRLPPSVFPFLPIK